MGRIKMSSKAQCNAKTVRYYYFLGRKGTEKKIGKKRKNVGAPYNM
jgi:hypothetical protein